MVAPTAARAVIGTQMLAFSSALRPLSPPFPWTGNVGSFVGGGVGRNVGLCVGGDVGLLIDGDSGCGVDWVQLGSPKPGHPMPSQQEVRGSTKAPSHAPPWHITFE